MNILNNLKLSHRFALLICFFLAAFALYGALSFGVLSTLKVNGPVYQRIVQSKDLIADVLPPPLYIIESHLVSLQLAEAAERADQDKLIARLTKLKAEYDTRHAYWTKEGLESELAEALLKKAYAPAAEFYAMAINELIPGVQKHDQAMIASARVRMDHAYQQHRAEIDKVVRITGLRAEADEAAAKDKIQSYTLLLLVILAFAAAVGTLAALGLSRGIMRAVKEAVRIAEALAAGNLAQHVEVRSKDELGQMLGALMRTIEQLNIMMRNVKDTSDTVGAAAREIAQGHADLSSRTEEQASSLEQTAASMEEMTSTVSQNADNAKKASTLAAGATETAQAGGEAVRKVVQTMTGISDSSKKIADITSVIDGIAFQTNILALNASVEAARAGEQGRGFAVVASEVRSLAQRSAAAAKEIKGLISDSVAKVDSGSREVAEAGRTMEKIVESVKRVNSLIAEISAASQEQSQSISQVSDTVQQLEKVTQQNAAMVEQATAASASLEEQSNSLTQAVDSFRLADARQAAAQPAGPHPVAVSVPRRVAPVSLSKRSEKPAPKVRLGAPQKQAVGGAAKQDWKEF